MSDLEQKEYIEKYIKDPEFHKQEQEKSDNQLIQDRIELYQDEQKAQNPFFYIQAEELTETKITNIISKQLKGLVLYCEVEKTC